MATCNMPYVTPLETRGPRGVLNVRGGRASVETHLGRLCSLKMFDDKHVMMGASHKVTLKSLQFKCSANSYTVNHNQNSNPFLSQHPEISLLSGDENNSEAEDSLRGAKLKVIGVGGGGSNAVNRMVESHLTGVEFWIVNTDLQSLRMSPVSPEQRMVIGQELTRGLGAGGNPDVGMNAANESKESIKEAVSGADMVFVTAGMGGGTGTGGAPIIAGVAKSLGVLTVGIVTTPFSFEGRKRAIQAQEGIAALRENVDTLIVIRNDKLLTAASQSLSLNDAFKKVDDILRQAVLGVCEIITKSGEVNVDFADVRTIMQNAGSALMGIGTGTGKTRAKDAALAAIESPLLDVGIERATGVVWTITASDSLTMLEVNDAAELIKDMVDPNANIIFGHVQDMSMNDQLSIILIATGFKREEESNESQEGPQGKGGNSGGNIPSSSGGVSRIIPEFLQKKIRSSRYPRG